MMMGDGNRHVSHFMIFKLALQDISQTSGYAESRFLNNSSIQRDHALAQV
jgi:hypothetical protein